MQRALLYALTVFVLTSCSGTFRFQGLGSSDPPGWKCLRGDSRNTAYVRSEVGLPLQLLWKSGLGKSLRSSPAVVGRIVVIGSLNKRVHFLDATSGKRLGARKVPSAISNAACSHGSEVYLGLDRGKDSFLAINLASGRVRWKKDLVYPSSSPALCGNLILVGSSSGVLSALDRETGEEIWEFRTSAPVISTPSCNRTSSSSKGETVCFGSTDGHLYALESEGGGLLWRFQAGAGIYSSPAVNNGKVFFTSVDGYLHALDAKDGSPEWSFKTGADTYSSPAVCDSLVYVGSNDHHMYAVHQNTGGLVWKFRTGGLVRSSPVAVGDKLFFGSYDGNLYVLDRFSGDLLWKYQTDGMISSSPAYHDGKVYLASEDGNLYCFGF